jgi:hypothetical protein
MNKKVGNSISGLKRTLNYLEDTIMWCQIRGHMSILTDDEEIMREWQRITELAQRSFEGLEDYCNGRPRIHRLIPEGRSEDMRLLTREDNPKYWEAAGAPTPPPKGECG